MTRLNPTLQLKRLVVLRSGATAYDETYHSGLNIIRSVGNSRGKSTIADFIFFALGGDLSTWKDEAKLCDRIFAEVEINGGLITIQRDITDKGQQPMSIYIGPYDVASRATAGWQRYPYGRYGDKASFTQVLFGFLGFPEVPGEAGANLTMHQCLRLMYVDQMTPVNKIFRFETPDSPRRRQAVGDLLCGILDHQIYADQLALRDTENSYVLADQSLKGVYAVLDKVEQQPTVDMIDAEISVRRQERQTLRLRLEELKQRRYSGAGKAKDGQALIDDLQRKIEVLNAKISADGDRINELSLSIADAAMLISETERNLRALTQSLDMRTLVGAVSFHYCPSCLSPVAANGTAGICALCKTPLEASEERTRFLRVKNELDVQLKESVGLQLDRVAEIEKLRNGQQSALHDRDVLRERFLSFTLNYINDADPQIEETNTRLGYTESELKELHRKRLLAEQIKALIDSKAALKAEIDRLTTSITRLQKLKREREASVYGLINSKTVEIIGMDDHNQDEFLGVSRVHFDFAEDVVFVDGKIGFSASGLAVIRNAFHLALLWASALDKQFLYPRFILMDNIEDKGMTDDRSQNFQRKIADISASISVDHQIILTTSTIAPELDDARYTVGEKYTADRKSLNVSPVLPTA
jgi:uncharacterized coiled-coil protein SlyX